MENDPVPFRHLVPGLVALAILVCALLPAAASAEGPGVDLGVQVIGRTVGSGIWVNNLESTPLQVGTASITGKDAGEFAIVNDECASRTLAPGEQCVVEFTFSPLLPGLREAFLSIPEEGQPENPIRIYGTGQSKRLTVPGTAGFATTTVGGGIAYEHVLLKNSSEAGVQVEEVKIEGADAGDYAIEGNNCVGLLGNGMSCELSIRFTPGAPGTREAALHVFTDGTPSEYVTTLSGEGVPPEVIFEPGSYDFGLIEAHSGSPRTYFSLRNAGAASVQLSNLEITGGPTASEYWISGSGCWGTTLAPEGTCWIEVQFNANQEGSFPAAVSITADGTVFQAPLSAEVERPQVTASPAPLTFGPTAVGSRQVGEVTLTNTGRLPVGFYIAIVSGGDVASFHLVEETCTSNVFAGSPRFFEPGESCRAKIAFEPTEVGARHATVSVFGGGEGALQFSVEGTAIAPQLSLSPATHDFGAAAVGSVGPAQTFELHNESAEPQSIETVSLGGADVGEFQLRSDGCSETSIAPGGTCAVAVRFAPESGGAKTATLRLRGPGGTTVGRLSGEGTEAGATAAATATGRGWVSLTLRAHPRATAGKVTIGRARCESTEPCTVRIGGLASGRVATGAGLRPGIRGVAPTQLTLAPGQSAPITTALPREFRGITTGARLSVAFQWRTGAQHGGGRHSFLLGGGLRRPAG